MIKEIVVQSQDSQKKFEYFCQNLSLPITIDKTPPNKYILSQIKIENKINLQQYINGYEEDCQGYQQKPINEYEMSSDLFIALIIKILQETQKGLQKVPALQLYSLEAENIVFYLEEDFFLWQQDIFYIYNIEKQLKLIQDGNKPLLEDQIVKCVQKIIEKVIQSKLLSYGNKEGEGIGEGEESVSIIYYQNEDEVSQVRDMYAEENKQEFSNFLSYASYQSLASQPDPWINCPQYIGLKAISTQNAFTSINLFIVSLANLLNNKLESKYILRNQDDIKIDLNYFNKRLQLKKKVFKSCTYHKLSTMVSEFEDRCCVSNIDINMSLGITPTIQDKNLLSQLFNPSNTQWNYKNVPQKLFYQDLLNCIIIESMSQYDQGPVDQNISQGSSIYLPKSYQLPENQSINNQSLHNQSIINQSIERAVKESLFQKHLYYVYLSLMRLASQSILYLSDDSKRGFSVVISAIRAILKMKYDQACDDLYEYSKYFALDKFKNGLESAGKDIFGYLQTSGCYVEHNAALNVQILPLKDFKEKCNYIQASSDAMVIQPPSEKVQIYLKMIKDLNKRNDSIKEESENSEL